MNTAFSRLSWGSFSFALTAVLASAQVVVTGVSYGPRQNGADQSQGGVTFRNEFYGVTGVSTAVGDYTFNGPLAQHVYVRRNTSSGNPNNTTLFYQVDSNDRAFGTKPTTVEDVLLSGNLFTGLRDPFANTGSSSSSQNTNIERIDFYLGPTLVQAGAGIVLFDLENVGNFGDSFRIAAFSGWSSSSAAPTSYVNTGKVIGDGSFGPSLLSPTDNGSLEFNRATYTNGNNLSGSASNFTALGGDLNMVGILIRFTDLGLAVGSTITGFSLMAADVQVTKASDLVNWNNASVYRTDTNRNTYGNFDMMGFGAQLASPVPEPTTYGALFMGLVGAGYVLRRRRATALKPAA